MALMLFTLMMGVEEAQHLETSEGNVYHMHHVDYSD